MTEAISRLPEVNQTELPWMPTCPEHWSVVRPKTIFRRMQRPVRPEDGVVTAFRDGVVTLRKNRRTTGFTEALQEIGYQGIRKGDLVIHAMDAFAGAIGVSDSDGKGTPVYSVCQPIGGANSWYYALVLREMSRSGYLLSLAKGIRERSTDFRFADFASLMVPLPPVEEQKQIVRYVRHLDSKVNRLIKAKRRLIELLNEQKQATIHQAVTRGFDPNVSLKPSGIDWLGDIPRNWNITPFKIGVGIQEGPGIMAVDFKEEGIPLIRISGMKGDSVSLRGCNYLSAEKVATRWSHFRLVEGDWLLSASASSGDIAEVGREVAGAIAYTGLIRLWKKNHLVNMEYISYFIRSTLFQTQVSWLKTGVGIEHYGPSHLKKMWILLPELVEQLKIVSHIKSLNEPIDQGIVKIQKEIDLIREYRTRLVADVVTGQLDVRNVELPEIEEELGEITDNPADDELEDSDEILEEVEA